MKNKFILFLCVLLFQCYYVLSGVNLKNGNFNVSYSDIKFSDIELKEFEILRTYNSKAVGKGWFGNGWGSLFETFLTTTPDYGVIIFNHGTGGKEGLHSKKRDEASVMNMINLIIDAAKIDQLFNQEEKYAELKTKLINSTEIRNNYYNTYVKKGLLNFIIPEEGFKYYSTACGCPGDKGSNYKYVIYENHEFKLHDPVADKILTFDTTGRLIRYSSYSNSELYISLYYKMDNSLSINLKNEQSMSLYFNQNKTVDSIVSYFKNKKYKSAYKYENGNLVFSENMSGNMIEHIYDANYNMTHIIYNPNRLKVDPVDQMVMNYYEKTFYIESILHRNGDKEKFEYYGDKNDYGTKVTRKDKNDSLLLFYEKSYSIRTNEFGDRWNSKSVIIINSDTTNLLYDPISNKPAETIRSEQKVRINYDPKGNLTSFVMNGSDTVKFILNSKSDISQVKFQNQLYTIIYDDKNKPLELINENSRIQLPINSYLDLTVESRETIRSIDKTLSAMGYNIFSQPDSRIYK